MKKKLVFLLTAIVSAASLCAQEGEIIYTDYGPEGWSYEFNRMGPDDFDTLQIDFDNDGIVDVYYKGNAWSAPAPEIPDVVLLRYNERAAMSYNQYDDGNGGFWYTEIYGDTIANASPWRGIYTFMHGFFDSPERPYARYIAIRISQEDGGYCYGWLEQSIEWIMYPESPGSYFEYYHNGLVKIYRWAFCTIPDYPLCVGQTSFDWGIEYNEESNFASIHPNPTSGLVTVTGQDLKTAEVFNPLGQLVATSTGEGERLTVDITHLSAGVYVVNVTDTEGRKCVRKVVKE